MLKLHGLRRPVKMIAFSTCEFRLVISLNEAPYQMISFSGLLEPRINNGTKNVFESIEEISRNIDALDNGVELQSNPD